MRPHALVLSLLAGVLLAACTSSPAPSPSEVPAVTPTPATTGSKEVAVLKTNFGNIVIEFLSDKAPGHVENFKKLAHSGFYDGTAFHRVIPGFMIQGGDPNSKDDDRTNDGMGGPGYSIRAEFNDVPFERGVVGMARSQNPNSAGSQFFIMVARYPSLDGQYTAFGKVVQGMDVADEIVNLPRDARDNPLQKAVMNRVTIEGRS